MLDLCQAFVVPSEAQRFPPPGVDSEMRNEKMASRCANGRSGFPMLILVGMALLGKAAPAQTIRVATTAGRAIRFDPDQALGSSMDILPANLVDKVYSEPILKESLSAGWGPITYRQNTELTIAAWHWNPIGSWSDAANKSGYFTGSAEPTETLRMSYGYTLPHRGNTRNGGASHGYSRLTDGDPATYWKSNPYLSSRLTGESDLRH